MKISNKAVTLEKFTASETNRINEIYAEDFKGDICADDIALISRFERMKAQNELETEKNEAEIKAHLQMASDNAQAILNQTLNNLNMQHARAMARYDNLDKGF